MRPEGATRNLDLIMCRAAAERLEMGGEGRQRRVGHAGAWLARTFVERQPDYSVERLTVVGVVGSARDARVQLSVGRPEHGGCLPDKRRSRASDARSLRASSSLITTAVRSVRIGTVSAGSVRGTVPRTHSVPRRCPDGAVSGAPA